MLIDLDGTLINTADKAYKPMKEGRTATDLSAIQLFEGAKHLLENANERGFQCLIVSDSHPRYVQTIASHFFQGVPALDLADKPNTAKVVGFLRSLGIADCGQKCFVIGDTWLDIELGRGLKMPTILVELYKSSCLEARDGIGDYRKNIGSGPTYCVNSLSEILRILDSPEENLLCLEAGLLDFNSTAARRPRKEVPESGNLSLHRVLARQAKGECDRFNATDAYLEFSRRGRRVELLAAIQRSVVSYLREVLSHNKFDWNLVTYVPDKDTTEPPNKMGQLFDLITQELHKERPELKCEKIFEWKSGLKSSTRQQATAPMRRSFVQDNLRLKPSLKVEGKSVIIIDDQYTTGATADELTRQLVMQGAKNVLFIALFHLVSCVKSDKLCPRCLEDGLSKQMQIKINRSDGSKFYSCVPPEFKGDGCGYTENIE